MKRSAMAIRDIIQPAVVQAMNNLRVLLQR
jgi:hypothetical protein